mmetsp:Transcript_69628/g.148949  ORF Transcript_69628/g.148949 Transcript_69628/m.148949 type:complete len:421 (+) Transcript_69628:84-1346(+)
MATACTLPEMYNVPTMPMDFQSVPGACPHPRAGYYNPFPSGEAAVDPAPLGRVLGRLNQDPHIIDDLKKALARRLLESLSTEELMHVAWYFEVNVSHAGTSPLHPTPLPSPSVPGLVPQVAPSPPLANSGVRSTAAEFPADPAARMSPSDHWLVTEPGGDDSNGLSNASARAQLPSIPGVPPGKLGAALAGVGAAVGQPPRGSRSAIEEAANIPSETCVGDADWVVKDYHSSLILVHMLPPAWGNELRLRQALEDSGFLAGADFDAILTDEARKFCLVRFRALSCAKALSKLLNCGGGVWPDGVGPWPTGVVAAPAQMPAYATYRKIMHETLFDAPKSIPPATGASTSHGTPAEAQVDAERRAALAGQFLQNAIPEGFSLALQNAVMQNSMPQVDAKGMRGWMQPPGMSWGSGGPCQTTL